jgi:hypothetical protein
MVEIAQYAEDGVNIMIDNGWLEQPPKSPGSCKRQNVIKTNPISKRLH